MTSVLVIDSESAVAEELKSDLEGRGVSAHVTGDGSEGLEFARQNKPKLIVLCVELTRGSGYSVCNKLKKDSQLATIPLILTSSQATEETFEQHKKLRTRAEAYLKKPFRFEQIADLMQEYIDVGAGATVEAEVEVDVDDGLEADLEVSAEDISVEADYEEQRTQVMPGLSGGSVSEHGETMVMAVGMQGKRRSTQVV
ncbi:MAG: response regulator, partial [Myxococcota bacterium]